MILRFLSIFYVHELYRSRLSRHWTRGAVCIHTITV